ncbi:uncharacterized protein A4U43_C07F32560 [Asparagus officinalis]|uniref:Uncharacterized protein n=1 Tax=Asparagus officinalis TaxID=4686 RepID=A0A5P1EGM5_ASPOF|nr:uncharacterized protein A4U43_C07F32560 [Asparagus officinalis]
MLISGNTEMVYAVEWSVDWEDAGFLQTGHLDTSATANLAGLSSESTKWRTLSGFFLASFPTVPSIMPATMNQCMSLSHLFRQLRISPSLIHVFGPIVDLETV